MASYRGSQAGFRYLIGIPFAPFKEFFELKGHHLAAAIAFYAYLSLFPMTIALITLFHLLFGDTEFNTVLVDSLTQQIPALSASSGPSFVENFVNEAASKPAVTSSLSGLIFFFSAMGVFGAIRDSLNTMWRVKRQRSFIKQKCIDIAMMVVASSLMITSVLVSALYSFVGEISYLFGEDSQQFSNIAFGVAGIVTPVLITFVVFTWLYAWVPNVKVRAKQIAPIALVAAIAFECAKIGFIYYLRFGAERFLTAYGSVATVMMFFMFMYVSAMILLIGALLSAKWIGFIRSSTAR